MASSQDATNHGSKSRVIARKVAHFDTQHPGIPVAVRSGTRGAGLMRSVVVRVLGYACFAFFLVGSARNASAQETVSLAWDPSPDPGVIGYMLSWGTRLGEYTNSLDVSVQTSWTLSGLSRHQRYYFIVQAYDAERTLSESTTPVENGGLIVQTGAQLQDPRPSLFWRHEETGELLTWHLSGINVVDTRPLPNPDLGWKIAGTGDLNGDGSTDIVWRHANGGLAAWFLLNNSVIQTGFLSIPVIGDRGWRLAGVGDTDGDKRADLVWQHTNGSLGIWFMNGMQVRSTNFLGIPRVSDVDWQIAAVGDIDSDQRADLVWRHRDGWIATWLLRGTAVTSTLFFSVDRVADPAWRIAAAGKTDAVSPPALVWQHETGWLGVWYVNGPSVLSTSFLSPAFILDTKWAIVGAR